MRIEQIRKRAQQARLARALTPRFKTPVIRLGSEYGGWIIPQDLITSESVVYSAGVGEDVTFDLELIALTGCQVWAFDPTPRSIDFARKVDDERFHFAPTGVWSRDETRRFYAPRDPSHVSHSTVSPHDERDFFDAECKSLSTIKRELGHDRIDLLKLDIEGAEYDVLGSLNETPRCICVELHPIRPLGEIVELVRSLSYEPLHLEGWSITLGRV
jgi:FkbM family methyltransferase